MTQKQRSANKHILKYSVCVLKTLTFKLDRICTSQLSTTLPFLNFFIADTSGNVYFYFKKFLLKFFFVDVVVVEVVKIMFLLFYRQLQFFFISQMNHKKCTSAVEDKVKLNFGKKLSQKFIIFHNKEEVFA